MLKLGRLILAANEYGYRCQHRLLNLNIEIYGPTKDICHGCL